MQRAIFLFCFFSAGRPAERKRRGAVPSFFPSAPAGTGPNAACAAFFQLFSTISSLFGAFVMTSAPSGRMIMTSSMRTPNLPGR